ncbi:hypothetical protein [Clostridium sp. YIM B02551]|uniref:hypothetical protein n=1 Tax=Clostridium sp. YIM B02551 TaxID=2910679 RepID=UPI001EEAA7C3|nr:hypothetical protein [Clostridium sp. YIM B02551]
MIKIMKRYLACKKGQISAILLIYIMIFSILIVSIYKLVSINISKEYIYPFKENQIKTMGENDIKLINNYISQINKNTFKEKKDLEDFLKINNIIAKSGENQVYYDISQNKIIFIRKLEAGKLKYRFDFDYNDGEIYLIEDTYYEGVM